VECYQQLTLQRQAKTPRHHGHSNHSRSCPCCGAKVESSMKGARSERHKAAVRLRRRYKQKRNDVRATARSQGQPASTMAPMLLLAPVALLLAFCSALARPSCSRRSATCLAKGRHMRNGHT
jgi:hypothetical protein